MPKAASDRLEQRKQTRQKLVDAALELFSTSGYEHATVDDVSAAAGYSKGAYYFHFSTKDDILLELLRVWTEGRTEALQRAGAEDSAMDALRGQLAAFLSYEEAPTWPAVLLEFWAQAARNPEVGKRLTAAYAGWRKQLEQTVELAKREGALAGETRDLAELMLTAHDGFAVQRAIGGAAAITVADVVDALIAPAQTAITERRAAAM